MFGIIIFFFFYFCVLQYGDPWGICWFCFENTLLIQLVFFMTTIIHAFFFPFLFLVGWILSIICRWSLYISLSLSLAFCKPLKSSNREGERLFEIRCFVVYGERRVFSTLWPLEVWWHDQLKIVHLMKEFLGS